MKALLPLLILALSARAYWTIEIVDSAGSNTGKGCSISLSGDTPCISYTSDNTDPNVMCAVWNGSAWQIDVADSLCEAVDTSIDTFGDEMFISYTKLPFEDLIYTHWDGSSWSNYPLDSSIQIDIPTKIRIDSFGNPHILYCDDLNETIRYAHFNGTEWLFETISDPSHAAKYPDFILDENNVPHVLYRNQFTSDLIYTTFTGAYWHSEKIGSFCSPGGFSIDLDSGGYPHVAFLNYTTNLNLCYGYYDGSNWFINTVINGDPGMGDHVSLALNSSDEPSIAFCDVTPAGLRYAFWSNGWHFEVIDTGAGMGLYCSHEIDSNDCAHIAYYNEDEGELRYARWNILGIEDSTDASDISVSSNPFNELLYVTLGEITASSVTVHDISGHLVSELAPDNNGVYLWDGANSRGSEVPSGMYFILCKVNGQLSTLSVVKI